MRCIRPRFIHSGICRIQKNVSQKPLILPFHRYFSSIERGHHQSASTILQENDGEEIIIDVPCVGPIMSDFINDEKHEFDDEIDSGDDDDNVDLSDNDDEEEDEDDDNVSYTKYFYDSDSSLSTNHFISKDDHYDSLVEKYLQSAGKQFSIKEIQEMKQCMRYLCSRAKRRQAFSPVSEGGKDCGFEDARNCENLLKLAINIAKEGDRDEIVHHDFDTAITAWHNAAFSAYDTFGSKTTIDIVSLQRLRATRWLYVNERAESLFRIMEDLSKKGFPSLRPSQYSYELIIAGWAKASRALNFCIRGEGKAAAMSTTKLPTRKRLSKADNEKTPWRNERIIDKYSITGPARKVDKMLQRLMTMAEVDGSEFSVSAWAIYEAAKSYVYIKTKPKRFHKDDESDPTYVRRLKEESFIPRRAEELLWMLVDLDAGEDEDEKFLKKRSKLFRDVISSWSHSNDPEGHYHAERILTRMGELYENGYLKCEPTSDIFSAVVGAWSRRSISLPFEAPERCIAILKHMEQIADRSKNTSNEKDNIGEDNTPKWVNFSLDERVYLTCFGAFRSALHSPKLRTVEGAFRLASEADAFLSHIFLRNKNHPTSGVLPDPFMFETVLMCYSNVVNVLTESNESKDGILKDVGVDFMITPDLLNEMELETTLIRVNEIMNEMEDTLLQLGRSDLTSNIYLPAIIAWSNATKIPNSSDEVLGILYRVLALYRTQKMEQVPTTEIFDVAINVALKSGHIQEAVDILRDQESLYFDSECSPVCKPNIATYRSLLVSCGDDNEMTNEILTSMARVYETNVVDELFKDMGSTNLGFQEILQLWGELDGKQAAEWAEAFLLRIAKEAVNSKNASTPAILSYQNFDATILTWCKAKRSDRAEKLLREVLRLRKHPIFSQLQPPYKTFDLVIRSMVSSSNKTSFIKKAENLLRDMPSPNLRSVNFVLRGYSQVRDSKFDAAHHARDLFLWALKCHNHPDNIHMKNPCKSFQSYASVMSAAIKLGNASNEQKRKNYDIALSTFKDWTSHNDIDSRSVYYIMNAAARLLPFKERQEHITAIFKRCQQKGIVSEAIFNVFKEGSSSQVFSAITNGLSKQNTFYEHLPKDWVFAVRDYPP